jgi:hypothetical protein
MPPFPVHVIDPDSGEPRPALEVTLNKVPKLGSDFVVPGVGLARVKEVRMIGGEKVIFAVPRPQR